MQTGGLLRDVDLRKVIDLGWIDGPAHRPRSHAVSPTGVDRGMTPLQAIQSATTLAAELVDKDDRGRLEAGLFADVIAVAGNPLDDIAATEQVRFVVRGGAVYGDDT